MNLSFIESFIYWPWWISKNPTVSATSLSGHSGPSPICPRPPQISSFQCQWTFYLGLCSRPFPPSRNCLLSARTLPWPCQPCAGVHLSSAPPPPQASPPPPCFQTLRLPGTTLCPPSILGHLPIPTTRRYHLSANDPPIYNACPNLPLWGPDSRKYLLASFAQMWHRCLKLSSQTNKQTNIPNFRQQNKV